MLTTSHILILLPDGDPIKELIVTSDDLVRDAYYSFVNSIRSESSSSEDLMVKAYVELKKWIFIHRIVPGQKLIYKDLANKLKMSKTPIIYALTRLEYEGFVERLLNRGYFVHEMNREEAGELFDAREAVEIYSLEKMVGSLARSDIEEIERIIAYHGETDYGDMRKRLILDMTLHLKLTEITGNNYLIRMLRGLFERLYLTYRFDRLDPQRKTASEHEHAMIFKVIKDMDTEGARNLLQQHIRNGKKALIKGLGDFLPESAGA